MICWGFFRIFFVVFRGYWVEIIIRLWSTSDGTCTARAYRTQYLDKNSRNWLLLGAQVSSRCVYWQFHTKKNNSKKYMKMSSFRRVLSFSSGILHKQAGRGMWTQNHPSTTLTTECFSGLNITIRIKCKVFYIECKFVDIFNIECKFICNKIT